MGRTARKLLLPAHRWAGLGAGLPLLLVALTGAGMAFRPVLEPLVEARHQKVPACAARLELDALVASARRAYPQAGSLSAIRSFGAPDRSTWIDLGDDHWVYLDPCSGKVLGRQVRYGGLFGTLGYLHTLRFLDGHSTLAGGVALILALMAAGGLALWWPAPGAFRAAARLEPRLRGRAFSLGPHKVAGLYACPVLLLSALTGAPQSLEWARNALFRIAGSALPAAPLRIEAAPGAARLPLAVLAARAQALVPDARKMQLRYPQAPRDALRIELVGRDAPHMQALSYVALDPYSGKVLGFTAYADTSAGQRLFNWMLALHYGWVGGIAGQLLLFAGALGLPVLAWTGTLNYLRRPRRPARAAPLTLRVRAKCSVAQDICSFELVDPGGASLPPFEAGAHIEVQLPGGLVRHYSLCNDPGERQRYLIGVLRTPDSRGGSQAMHEQVHEGDLLQIGLPRNHFPLVHGARRSLLLAGGIGVTPILSMAEHLEASGAEFEMHYCSRSPARAAFAERIRQAPYARRVHFHHSEGAQASKVDLAQLLGAPEPGLHLYVCGPDGFMNAVTGMAKQQGWAAAQVHREHFGAAIPANHADLPFDLRIASSGRVIRVASGQSALDALAECGIVLPSSCREGVCGSCVTPVLGGEPDHRDVFLSEPERARNDQFTPCCSRAKGPLLVLDL